MNYSKDDYALMYLKRKSALQKIADKLGKDHQITKMMGTMAWGRNNSEPGVSAGLREYVEAKGFLDGAFNILNLWARDNDLNAQRIMLSVYPSGYESDSSERK